MILSGGDGMMYLEAIFKYLQDEHVDKKKAPLPQIDEWQLISTTKDTPSMQRNGELRPIHFCDLSVFFITLLNRALSLVSRLATGFDCGVFTCMFADFLSKDCPLVFFSKAHHAM
jgi:hypothetical protein